MYHVWQTDIPHNQTNTKSINAIIHDETTPVLVNVSSVFLMIFVENKEKGAQIINGIMKNIEREINILFRIISIYLCHLTPISLYKE
jgi:hypothetical protein